MTRVALACLLIIVPVAVASADVSPIKQRKAILKKFGDATRPLAAMVKNRQAFDVQLLKEALETYSTGARKLPDLFPETSKTGDDTEARPAIWEDKAKFDALFKKLGDDATAAQSKIVDEASFRATLPKLLGDCKECHDIFREKK